VASNRCDAAKVIADRVGFWSVLAEDQRRTWRFDRDASTAVVAVHQHELSAAIDVLLENVFAHTEDGVGLEVFVELRDDDVRIGVGDAGTGFDRALIAAGESGAGSTGLGLHIARRCAERAGGRMEVGRSDLGGARVVLVFPVAEGL